MLTDSKETSVKQSIEGQSPKRRKVDTEKDREPKNEEQRVPLDKVETGNSRTVSKRKLPTPTNTETNAEFKKRKICDPNESFDNATEHLKMDTKNDIGTTDKNLSSNTNKQEETENDKNKKESNDAKEEDNLKEETSEGVRKKRIRKIKLPEDATDNKQNNDYAVSTYDKVRLIIQPWRKPEGGINKPIFKMMLESIMLYLMMNPGSPEDALVKRYNPYLQPMIIRNIVDVLEDIGCVSRQFISKPKPSLFSKPSIPHIGGEEEEDSTVLMVPAEDCVIKLGQFGQEVFPNAKWPENTYLPHEREEMTEK